MNKLSNFFLTVSAVCSIQAMAQKPPLDHSVYDNWKTIGQSQISASGGFIFYAITPQEGDALLELKTMANRTVLQVPRGQNAAFSSNEQFFVSSIKAPFSDIRQARIKKKKPDEYPKDSLLVYDVQADKVQKFGAVKSYKLPRLGKDYIAFLSEVVVPTSTSSDSLGQRQDSTARAPRNRREKPLTVLHLLHMGTGDTTNFIYGDQYSWSDDERYLVFSKHATGKDSLSDMSGVYLYDLTNRSIKKISGGKGTYKQFTFDDSNEQLAFLAYKGDEKALSKSYDLYYYTPQQDSARVLANAQSAGLPENWWVSGDGRLNFSANGEKLYMGLAPIPRVRDTSLVDFEHAKLDIWHWKDDYLQPQQLVNLRRNQSRSYDAVVHPRRSHLIVPLADEKFDRVITTDTGNEEWALVTTDFGNRIASQWEARTFSDVYLVSTETGKNRKIIDSLNGQVYLSPDASYVLYFDREKATWNSFEMASGQQRVLTEDVAASFVDEENDVPALPGSYGLAGWSTNGKTVYINDRYDIWSFDLDGSKKEMITNGFGRSAKTRFRIASLKPKENPRYQTTYIPSGETIFLTAFQEQTKNAGMYTTQVGRRNRDPKQVVLESKSFRQWASDRGGKHLIYTKEDYQHSPDLYLNTADMNREQRLTDINPQQSRYNWGTAELVHWTTPKGYAAEGILYKPEDFDSTKKYPIVAYFYEKLSDGLHTYQAPAPTPSRLNISYFVSNGYLVFAPNIAYETGHPGQAAEEFINSGMHYLARHHTFVDSTKMGIQGQSWGGYQVAHLITRTSMYAAAWTGAPVVNMTSAYGGIRWGSGMSRQFQYENTQSRIGQNLWEAHDLYIENSPLFSLNRVTTPVVIMHNDNDGAVPWYQGIEMFTALRRLQKPVWLLNYNGDEHNLILRQNRKDIQQREIQFFDHYLKDKPAARWITDGVPAIHKGIDWGLEVE